MTTDESLDRGTQNEPTQTSNNTKASRLFNAALILVSFILTCGAIAFGSYFSGEESLLGITVGQPSTVNILAPRNVVNTLATERNREDALARANALLPVRTMDTHIWPLVENNLNILAESMAGIREFHAEEIASFEQAILDAEAEYYAANLQHDIDMEEWTRLVDSLIADGIAAEDLPPMPESPILQDIEPVFIAWLRFLTLPIDFSETQRELILSMDEDSYGQLWEVIMDVAYTIQATNIDEVDSLTLLALRAYLGEWPLDQNTRSIVESVVIEHLSANQIVDEVLTQANWENAARNYQEIELLEGEIIVNIGQIITEDIYTILGDLGMLEDTTIWDLAIPIGGTFILVALLFMACLRYLFYYRPLLLLLSVRRSFCLHYTLL